MKITDYIPTGQANAISRKELIKQTKLTDRELRKAIHTAKKEQPICNLSNGKGYFIAETEEEATRYKLQEIARIKSIAIALQGVNRFIQEVS